MPAQVKQTNKSHVKLVKTSAQVSIYAPLQVEWAGEKASQRVASMGRSMMRIIFKAPAQKRRFERVSKSSPARKSSTWTGRGGMWWMKLLLLCDYVRTVDDYIYNYIVRLVLLGWWASSSHAACLAFVLPTCLNLNRWQSDSLSLKSCLRLQHQNLNQQTNNKQA